MNGLWKLTWLELKIFAREPLGLLGSVAMPVVVFLVMGRVLGRRMAAPAQPSTLLAVEIPVLVAMLIALSAVLSLVTIISIYRESGILKRLRATPLRPVTILSAHVLVKLLLTAGTLALMVLAGRRYYPAGVDAPVMKFAAALLVTSLSIMSLGFIIASVVPTARFAQPFGSVVLYPMLALSGLFVPVEAFPPALQTLARALPLTYAVSLLKGMWRDEPWAMHVTDVAALAGVFVVSVVVSSRVFRWE